jgi:hypothetical protein
LQSQTANNANQAMMPGRSAFLSYVVQMPLFLRLIALQSGRLKPFASEAATGVPIYRGANALGWRNSEGIGFGDIANLGFDYYPASWKASRLSLGLVRSSNAVFANISAASLLAVR